MGNFRIKTQRPLVTSALLVVAILIGLALWRLKQEPAPSNPSDQRSDYVLRNYELVALNAEGAESFTVKGPYLQRDPGGKSLSLHTPQFFFPDASGGRWSMTSKLAWVAEKGEEVRLINDVTMIGPATNSGDRTHFNTNNLQVFPKRHLAQSDDTVTIAQTSSILQGQGLRADLKAKQFQLLANVKGRYAPPSR